MKELELAKYLAVVQRLEKHFMGFTLHHIARGENTKVDELAKAVAQGAPMW